MSSTKTSFLIALLAIGTLGVSAVQAVEDCLSNHAKSAQEGAKDADRRPKTLPRAPKSAQKRPKKVIWEVGANPFRFFRHPRVV